MDGLQREIAARIEAGGRMLSVKEMDAEFRTLGYRLDRNGDCRSMARYMTGERAGESYPCISTWIVEADTGRKWCNADARRDANFEAVQRLRMEVFAVTRGAILEV
jgi:hypothetical protein